MVKFVKQSDISKYPKRCFSAALSSSYKDVFHNNQTTIDISNVPSDTGMFIEIPTSETPPYGSGNVVGYKLGLYLNDIVTDQASNPSLTIWKAKRGITGAEGNFGTTILKGTDIYSMSSYPEYSADGYFSEDFSDTKAGTTAVLDKGVRTVALGSWYSKPHILWEERRLVTNPTNATTMSYEEWKDEWGAKIQTGAGATDLMDVIYIELKEKIIPGLDLSWSAVYGDDDVLPTRKYWIMDKQGEGTNSLTKGYMEWDEGNLKGTGGNQKRWNSYTLTYPLTASAELPIDIADTTLSEIMTSPEGTSMRLSETSDGSKNIFKNGLFKDTDALTGDSAVRFQSLIDSGITDADKGMKELFLAVDVGEVESNGFLMTNCIKQTSFPTPIQLTKRKDKDSDQEAGGTSDVTGTDLVFTVKLASMPEICCSSSSVAYFPSRCLAVWFKNRLDDSTENDYDNIAQDVFHNYYSADSTNFTAMNDASTPAGQNIFCGFFIYKFNGSLYFKSLAKPLDGETSRSGPNFGVAGAGEEGTSYVPYNFQGHPTEDAVGGTTGTIKLGNIANKWIDIVCRWKSGSGNGFELILRDANTKNLLHDQIHVETTALGTPNDDYAFPYYSFATYNCATLGSGGSNINHRPEFQGLGTSAESGNQASSNTRQELSVVLDRIAMSKYGLNYTHLNSTIQDERPAAKISIATHDGPDFSATLTKGNKMTLASERTAADAPALPTFLSFGFKNAADVKGANSNYPKHLYFSGFTCGNVAGNSAVPESYMKWCWTTDAARLGKQLWSNNAADDDGVDVGTLSESNNQFQLSGGSQNMYFTSADAGAGPNPTNILLNEGFQQKGHIFWDESDFVNHSKRENIFTSARIVGTNSRSNKTDTLITLDNNHIIVDDVNVLTKWKNGSDDSGETYSIYIYNKPNYKCWKKTGLTVNHVDDSTIEDLSGYTVIGLNKNPKRSDAYDAIAGTNIASTSCAFVVGTQVLTLVAPKIGGAGSVIDLREYFKAGDSIHISGTTSNNGYRTVASVAALAITFASGIVTETVASGVIKHRAGYDDLLVSTIGDLRYDDFYTSFISPERYWIIGEIHNQTTSDESLPAKNYDSVVLTDFDMTGSSVGPADFGVDDFGATFSEYKVTDSTINTNEWSLDRASSVGGVLDTQTDFGFGVYDAETKEGGYLQRFIPQLNFAEAAQYNIVDLSHMPVVDAGDSIYLWIHPQHTSSQTRTNISTFKDVATKQPFLLTTFEDEIPAHPSLSVEPYEENGYLPHYKWDSSEDDLWYGLLFIDNSQIMNQYHNMLYRIPLNENLTGYATSSYAGLIYLEDSDANLINPTMPDGIIEDRYDGLAGHSKRFSNTSNSMLRFPAANTGVGLGDKFSFICHITPDSTDLTEDTFIAYQRSDTNNTLDYSWQLKLTLQGVIELSLQGKKEDDNNTDVATVLTSASTIQRDDESPTMICWTLDNELGSGNVKLFINGILEASTGLLRTSSVLNNTNQWAKNLVLDPDVEEMCIGGDYPHDAGITDYDCFSGKIEEIAAYNDVIYPVNPRKGEFVWKKPIKDFVGARGTPLSYVARLFVKDFHNIRGRSTSDVAVSPPVSFIKPILGNRGD